MPAPATRARAPARLCGRYWDALEAHCSPAWATSAAAAAEPGGAKPGGRAMALEQMQRLALSWVDPRFAGNAKKLYTDGGWMPNGFMTYYGGELCSKIAAGHALHSA